MKTPPTTQQALLAACMAAGDGVAPHRSAAALWTLAGGEATSPEISVVGSRRPELRLVPRWFDLTRRARHVIGSLAGQLVPACPA